MLPEELTLPEECTLLKFTITRIPALPATTGCKLSVTKLHPDGRPGKALMHLVSALTVL